MDRTKRQFFERIYKLDRVLALILLIMVSPVIGVLALLVKRSSEGPALYKQKRVGLRGEAFTIYKLRTMVEDAEPDGKAIWCDENDVRVTEFGEWLRKRHLDELPQLFNVVRGDMSLVGPRPERPSICRDLAEKIDGYYQRNAIKPGMTGLAQINLPPDTCLNSVRRKQVLDLLYVEEANLGLYLRMVWASGMRLCGRDGEEIIRRLQLCRRQYLEDLPDVDLECDSVESEMYEDASKLS